MYAQAVIGKLKVPFLRPSLGIAVGLCSFLHFVLASRGRCPRTEATREVGRESFLVFRQ